MKQLRHYILRIGLMLCALFAVLALYGVYSLTNYGSRWFSTSANTWLRSAKRDVIPGDVFDVNGVQLAGSAVTDTEDGFIATRRYHTDANVRRAVVHALGDTDGRVANGVETFMARALYGFDQSMPERLHDFFSHAKRKGDSLTLTLDSALSAYILREMEALRIPTDDGGAAASPAGAVVVMNWQTGAVLAEVSCPTFDPAQPGSGGKTSYFNRATQGLYAPGSTFKVVTAAAWLTDPQLSSRSFNCAGRLTLTNAKGQTRQITDAGTDSAGDILVTHGQIDLRRAFRVSCNNSFASAALQLTDERLRKQAMTFGFDANFLFRDIVVENSSYPEGVRGEWELAMTGIGQSDLLATPMHLCLIAAAIANDGVMMEPRLVQWATASNGTVRRGLTPTPAQAVTSAATAALLKEYMSDVVNEEGGTGSQAALKGWRVCGKTGSAEVDTQQRTNALFIGFIDDARAPYAVAIVLEDTGSGGVYAAPLAHDIFEYLTTHLQNGN